MVLKRRKAAHRIVSVPKQKAAKERLFLVSE
jgi:hypothetical protein